MLDHLALQCADVGPAADFYTRVLAPCGVRELMRYPGPDGSPIVALCGPDNFPRLWLGGAVDTGVRPVHLAIAAPSREAVDAVFALARATTEVLHEPRVWPEYHPGYYAVFFRDPDGNNVEAVHHTFPG